MSPGWKEGEGRQSAVKGAHTGLREMRHKDKTTQGSSGGFTPHPNTQVRRGKDRSGEEGLGRGVMKTEERSRCDKGAV